MWTEGSGAGGCRRNGAGPFPLTALLFVLVAAELKPVAVVRLGDLHRDHVSMLGGPAPGLRRLQGARQADPDIPRHLVEAWSPRAERQILTHAARSRADSACREPAHGIDAIAWFDPRYPALLIAGAIPAVLWIRFLAVLVRRLCDRRLACGETYARMWGRGLARTANEASWHERRGGVVDSPPTGARSTPAGDDCGSGGGRQVYHRARSLAKYCK